MNAWRDTVTIYNKSTSSNGTISWNRSVYKDCFWKETSSRSSSGGVSGNNASIIARIPQTAVVRNGDIAVKGNVSDVINEYSVGHRSTDVLKKYSSAFVISAVHDNTGTGRPCPHIYIEGA